MATPNSPKNSLMILVAGSANLDFVVRAQHIPAAGETVLGQAFHTYPGGKGANQTLAAAQSNLPTAQAVDAFLARQTAPSLSPA